MVSISLKFHVYSRTKELSNLILASVDWAISSRSKIRMSEIAWVRNKITGLKWNEISSWSVDFIISRDCLLQRTCNFCEHLCCRPNSFVEKIYTTSVAVANGKWTVLKLRNTINCGRNILPSVRNTVPSFFFSRLLCALQCKVIFSHFVEYRLL